MADVMTADEIEAHVVSSARNFLRDFPQFFEIDLGTLNVPTVRLPHPLVEACSLQVFQAREIVDSPEDPQGAQSLVMVQVPEADYTVDERNGLLKFGKLDYLNHRTVVAGYHLSWFLDADLRFHANIIIDEVFHGYEYDLGTLDSVYYEVAALGSVVHALWSLATELALDIDVSTPEGMYIPARQRFTQVTQMAQYWEGQYADKSAMLNIGLHRPEVFRMRRVAYLTNRYVPVYKEREFDNRHPPERIYPAIPYGGESHPPPGVNVTTSDSWVTVSSVETVVDLENVVTADEIFQESDDLGFGGWGTLGTRGDDCS